MYGEALETWPQEPLTSSAADLWVKRVPGLVDATRYYSEPADYEKSFTFASGSRERIYLDFGDGKPTDEMDKHSRFFAGLEAPVRDAAEVFVNGHFAASVWKPPCRLDVTNLLHDGENRLRIVVYNTAMNELAGRAAA